MTAKAKFDLTILPDGAIRLDTGDMSGPHHASADEFFKIVNALMGGQVDVKRKGKGVHAHADGTVHSHEHDEHHHHH